MDDWVLKHVEKWRKLEVPYFILHFGKKYLVRVSTINGTRL